MTLLIITPSNKTLKTNFRLAFYKTGEVLSKTICTRDSAIKLLYDNNKTEIDKRFKDIKIKFIDEI